MPTYEIDGRDIVIPAFVANGIGNSQSSDLSSLCLAFPLLIRRITLTNNGPIPPGVVGNWGLYHDRGGVYTAYSGYPITQNGSFAPLNPLIEMNISGGALGCAEVRFDEDSPLVFRQGDRLLIDVGCQGGGTVEPLVSLEFEVPFGSVAPPAPSPSIPSVVFGPTSVAGDNGSGPGTSVRVVSPPIGKMCSQTRVTLKGGSRVGLAARNASIGVQLIGPNTRDIPIELTFGGRSGFPQLAPGATITSDWANLAVPLGACLIVICDCDTTQNDLSLASGMATSSYWAANTQSYNVAAPPGFNLAHGTVYGLLSIEGQ